MANPARSSKKINTCGLDHDPTSCHLGQGRVASPRVSSGIENVRTLVRRIPVVHDHERDHAQQGQEAARQRVEKEHDRCPLPLRTSPQSDQEEERNQRELKKDIEEHHVETGEESQEPRLERQQKGIVEWSPFADRLPGRQHGRDHQQGREQEQPEGEAVQPECKADVGPCQPAQTVSPRLGLEGELRSQHAGPEGNKEDQAERHRGQRAAQSDAPCRTPVQPRRQNQDQAAKQRKQDRDRQECRHQSFLVSVAVSGEDVQNRSKMNSSTATPSAETAA